MKKLIQYIHMEILWYATVFGINDWKIFNLKWSEVKRDFIFFLNYLIISWLTTCAVVFGIYTSLENSESATFWWTTGMFSVMTYIIFGGLPFSRSKN